MLKRDTDSFRGVLERTQNVCWFDHSENEDFPQQEAVLFVPSL